MAGLDISEWQFSYSRKGAPVLRGVTLSVHPGELMVIVGKSGSGKTSLLRSLAGLVQGGSGVVRWEGTEIQSLDASRLPIAMVSQQPGLFPHLTIRQNLDLGLKARQVPRQEAASRIQHLCPQLGLDPLLDVFPSQLSAGQQSLAALARAMVLKTSWLFCDEPFSGLDPQTRREVRQVFLTAVKESGATVLFVTHDPAEAMGLGDRVAVLEEGRIVQVGAPATIYWRPESLAVADLLGTCPLQRLHAQWDPSGGVFRLAGDQISTPACWVWKVGAPAARSVLIGIRPEAVRCDEAEEPARSSGFLKGRIKATRNLGWEWWREIEISGAVLTSRSTGTASLLDHGRARGQEVRVSLNPILCFDPKEGGLIGYQNE